MPWLKNTDWIKKKVIALMFTVVLVTSVIPSRDAIAIDFSGFSNGSESVINDVIVLVVNRDLYELSGNFSGLSDRYGNLLQARSFRQRIDRYANDLVESNDGAEVRFLFFNEGDSTESLARSLQNIYLEGENNSYDLVGVVVIGDVPLPVVNKNGNRFVSVMPYVDFVDPVYVFEDGEFVLNGDLETAKQEAWHGVIRAPFEGNPGYVSLSQFFDKNHLYYQGVEEYADFDRKMFYADFIDEESRLNENMMQFYLEYLQEWEDLAYMRFNKFWANELSGKVLEGLTLESGTDAGQEFLRQLDSLDLTGMPDIYAQNVIENFLVPYYRVVSSHLSQVNDFTANTGRYVTTPEDPMPVDSVPVLISVKDEFSKTYIRNVNDALEKSIDELVEKIEVGLPLLKNSYLSGEFVRPNGTNTQFRVEYGSPDFNGEIQPYNTTTIYLPFMYFDDVTDDYYKNGVRSDVLVNAQQCSIYLGSTLDEYYDDNLNYNPKAVGGEYSILTRAMRSDNPITSMPVQTGGVTSRLLSSAEALSLTGNGSSSGEIIEANAEAGLPAFLNNPYLPGYRNIFDVMMKEGDVITKVNGLDIGPGYRFEKALEDLYNEANRLMREVNKDGGWANLKGNYDKRLFLRPDKANNPRDIRSIQARFEVEYYSNGEKKNFLTTFTVGRDGIADSGNAVMLVLFDDKFYDFTEEDLEESYFGGFAGRNSSIFFDGDNRSNAAIYTINSQIGGYANNGYGIDAGCNYANTSQNSDRCFYPVANYPVQDAGGAVMPLKTVYNGVSQLMFPERFEASVTEKNLLFQYPGVHENQPRSFADIDEVIINACYSGVSSVVPLSDDSNNYRNVLDENSRDGLGNSISEGDFWGEFLWKIAGFVRAYGQRIERSASEYYELWDDFADRDAGDIVLNNINGRIVTLKEFSDRYGLFDGVDNDGDGIRDYEWRDADGDGVFEQKFVDYDEADSRYGIPSWDLDQIARKMLSNNSKFVIPAGLPGNDFGQDLVLRVQVNGFSGKKISSMVMHKEPTAETIAEQVDAMGVQSLPIDNPRYVAFLAEATPLPNYPEPNPVDSDVDVEGIISKLDRNPHYFSGEIAKIYYPNLFDVESAEDLSDLLRESAWEIAKLPGSYKLLNGAQAVDCRDGSAGPAVCQQIFNEVLNNHLLPVVSGAVDSPASGFDLEIAQREKLIDALSWKKLSLDDKHEYVLKYYLGGKLNGFVSDSTLYPGTENEKKGLGYEAAYLVFDGKDQNIELGFNRDRNIEDGGNLLDLGYEDLEDEEEEDSESGSEEVTSERVRQNGEEKPAFVDLTQFLKEVEDFIGYFSEVPTFVGACSSEDLEDCLEGNKENIVDPASLNIDLVTNKALIQANGRDLALMSFSYRDQNNNVVPDGVNEMAEIRIQQDIDNPVVRVDGNSEKFVVGGVQNFVLRSTGNSGVAVVSVVGNGGSVSNNIAIRAVGSGITVNSFDVVSIGGEEARVTNIGAIAGSEKNIIFEAQLWDADKKLMQNTTGFVEVVSNSDNSLRFANKIVPISNGKAVFQASAGTVAGNVELKFRVLNTNGTANLEFAELLRLFSIFADEPARVRVVSESDLLVANGISQVKNYFTVEDRFGNVANNYFGKLSLFSNDLMKFKDSDDTNPGLVGTQISINEGRGEATVIAGTGIGTGSMTAVLLDYAVEEQLAAVNNQWSLVNMADVIGLAKNFEIVSNVGLRFDLSEEFLVAGENDRLQIGVELLNGQNVVNSYSGNISFTVKNPALGSLLGDVPKKMVNGRLHAANLVFEAGNISGPVEIEVDVPGFVRSVLRFEIVSGAAVGFVFDEEVSVENRKEAIVTVRLVDGYGNIVSGQSGVAEFSVENSDRLAIIGDARVSYNRGSATIGVRGLGHSGSVVLKVRSGSLEGETVVRVKNDISAVEISQIAPRVLYTSLLGSDWGDFSRRNNLAQSMLFAQDGQVQAVSTVLTNKDGGRKLVFVDGNGHIDLVDSGLVAETVISSSSFGHHRVKIRDGVKNLDLGEMVFVSDLNGGALVSSDEEKRAVLSSNSLSYVLVDSVENGSLGNWVMENRVIKFNSGGQVLVQVDALGRINIADSKVVARWMPSKKNFTIGIYHGNALIGQLEFVESYQSVRVVSSLTDISGAGVYFVGDNNFKTEFSFAGSSTADVKGIFVVDESRAMSNDQKPGLGYESPDDAGNSDGVGFRGDNKHMLLFAAGNNVGESNSFYGSEVGIVYGDPNIRLKVEEDTDLHGNLSSMGRDLGKVVATGSSNALEILEFNYNGDAFKDVLVIYENGNIGLLENKGGSRGFKERGNLLRVVGGIRSVVVGDFDNDGREDILVATEEECIVGEKCLSLFSNDNGRFVRGSFNAAINGKAVRMRTADINNDQCLDLVIADEASNIRIFYNEKSGSSCLGLSENHGGSFNFGYQVDNDVDGKSSLFVHYPGMSVGAESEKVALSMLDLQGVRKNYDFVSLLSDSRLGVQSKKTVTDVNGGSVAVGDTIRYLVTLENSSGSAISGLSLSDLTPASMKINTGSLRCLDLGCDDDLGFESTGLSLRSAVIKNISVPANGKRTISYDMVVTSIPEVNFELGRDFLKSDGSRVSANDGILDIRVRPRLNPSGSLFYLVSDAGLNNRNEVQYRLVEVPKTSVMLDGENESDYYEDLQNRYQQALNSGGEIPQDLINEFKALGLSPSDTNKNSETCQENLPNGGEEDDDDLGERIGRGVERTAGALTCAGGGCSPLPFNNAFFVPDESTPGVAVLALGVPNLLGFSFFYPSSAPSSTRFYVSPTLSLGLGTAVCSGLPTPTGGVCYTFAIPPSVLGDCPDFLGDLSEGIRNATNVDSDPISGQEVFGTGNSTSGGVDNTIINPRGTFNDPSSPVSGGGVVNVKVPGFPSFLVDWYDAQTDEIYNKLLDLPDFYFIYPDFEGVINDFVNDFDDLGDKLGEVSVFQSMNDILKALNSLPLINLRSKEIAVKIPSISYSELEKYKRQVELWIKNQEVQLMKLPEFWLCDENEYRKVLCDRFTLQINEFIAAMQELMDKLDSLARLPNEILDLRNAQSKYATELICYLDAITEVSGGYIKRQQKIVEAWLKAAEDVALAISDWKILLDVMVDYQESCDECKNDRFSKLGFLMEFFAIIPTPPIIQFPKWPDIVFDVSQVKMGTEILWPDVVFMPEPIVLPSLPDINLSPQLADIILQQQLDLPELETRLSLELEAFAVPDWIVNFPTFEMPTLPDLPPLPVPELPDLPRPPTIPKLSKPVRNIAKSLKPIFKILCLLKTGMVPVPEVTLKTEIETLTQPNIKSASSILKGLAVELPGIEYDYVKQIRIEAKLDMGISTDAIFEAARAGIEIWNDNVFELVNDINNRLNFNLQESFSSWQRREAEERESSNNNSQDGEDQVSSLTNEEVLALLEGTSVDGLYQESMLLSDLISDFVNEVSVPVEDVPESYNLVGSSRYLTSDDPLLQRSIGEIEQRIAVEDLPKGGEIEKIANLRNDLIAYTKELESVNLQFTNLEHSDLERFLVNANSNRLVADLDPVRTVGQATLEESFLGERVSSDLEAIGEDLRSTWIAATAGDIVPSSTNSTQGQSGTNTNKGLYLAFGNRNEGVLSYTEEIDEGLRTLFIDHDNDGDSDLLFLMGGTIYLKESHKNQPNKTTGSVKVAGDVADFLSAGMAVHGFDVVYENHRRADLSWNPVDGAVYYELWIKSSLNQDYRERDRYFVVADEDDAPGNASSDRIKVMGNPESPSVSLTLENGNYYAKVVAVLPDGTTNPTETILISPSECADKDAPLPVLRESNILLPIYVEGEIDASGAKDPSGEVVKFYLEDEDGKEIWSDLNVRVDDDGDGIPDNDRTNPMFKIGPFDELQERKFILHVVDQSGNSSKQEVKVTVFVPQIELNNIDQQSPVLTGRLVPGIVDFPIAFVRERLIYRNVDGDLKAAVESSFIKTEAIGEDERYRTDADGNFQVSDLKNDDFVTVQNIFGEVVVRVNPVTGAIERLSDKVELVVIPASLPDSPMRIEILEDGMLLGTMYLVADINVDVSLWQDVVFTGNLSRYNGINISDRNRNDDFSFMNIGADNPTYPGGAVLKGANNENMAYFDTAGNILLVNSSLSLRVKSNNFVDDPLVIEVVYGSSVVADVYVDTGGVFSFVGGNDVPYKTPQRPSQSLVEQAFNYEDRYADFAGLDNDLKDIVIDLSRKGILEGEQRGNQFFVNAEREISRAEFVKVLLEMLCIIPGSDAYLPYASGEGYDDIAYNADDLVWYYPYIKEATKRGLVNGYLGNTNPVTGLNPFRPEATISRAEATKVILEALEMQAIISLENMRIPFADEPWYAGYLEISGDLTDFIVSNAKSSFLLTNNEKQRPGELISRGTMLRMATRVLDIYNCHNIDENGNGMSDYCEIKYGITDPNGDEDGDGISNRDECANGGNPLVPDLEPEREVPGTPVNPGEIGLFIVPAECLTCPCGNTWSYSADLRAGDSVYAVILGKNGEILRKSARRN